MSARLKPESESNVIVAHHMGGWFEIDKSIFASVATLFAPLLTSNPEVKRVLLPDTVSSSVFVAFKGMFHGDEVDIELQDLVSFTFQLESIGVKVLRIYHNTLVNDVRPMVITKRLYKLWRAVILWPRHESDRLEEDRIRPFYTAYVPNDTPCQEFKLYEKQDMLKSVDFYGIHFSHGDFRNKLFVVGPNCKIFKVRRKKMVGLSYLKYNTFQQLAGDINYVVLPAQVSEYSFEKFESLLIHGSCEIEMEKFSEFRDELKSVGLSIERSECIAADHQSQYRVLATKDAHSMVKYICEWNPGYAFNPAEAIEEPIMEITHLTMNDVDPEQEPDSEPKPEPEAEPSKKRKCFI